MKPMFAALAHARNGPLTGPSLTDDRDVARFSDGVSHGVGEGADGSGPQRF